ncbi:MAG TPA: hypothetical protein VKR52_10420 [Terracidiphilus sp.]|nr:hypothetical protein [Terracidiphilus sp.]
MSWPRIAFLTTIAFGLSAAGVALAQYPGEIKKKDNAPTLRAVGVLEWTGEAGKPKKSRLVPITVFDGQQLQDGGEYLARPQPMAVEGGVEYVLQQDGKRIGLFDIDNSGQEQGSWVGLGSWKPMPAPKKPPKIAAPIDVDDTASDTPVLHRKHHSGDSTAGKSGSDSGSRGSSDPDRPTLHKKTSGDDSDSSDTSSGPAPDPDRPTLHKAPGSSDSGNSQADKGKRTAASEADASPVESVPEVSDPDRPRLMRGKPASNGPAVAPTLMGLPENMQQMVAVSDAQTRPDHPWDFSWANPDDKDKMKTQLEDTARTALGMNAPPPPVSKPKSRTVRAKARPATPLEPPPLQDEQFRVFELAYGSGATLVLTAHTDGPLAQQKFVTLIAQPDLYGSLLILFKHVTDGAHLDDNPEMRLIDAVDAMADNRGELLFELRGKSLRQFALYRVLRGTAQRLFVTSGGTFGDQAMN